MTLLSALLLAAEFFVHPAGSDAASGDLDHPWQTLAKVAATTLAPGDRVRLARGGTWHERLVAPSSGTAERPITFDAYGPGASPLLDGDDVREDLVDSNGRSHIVVRGIDTTDSRIANGGYGVRVHGGADVLVDDVTVTNAGKHAVGVINATQVTIRRARAVTLAAGQGYGGATAFVSYGDSPALLDTTWEDCEATTGSDDYPAFIEHGTGIRTTVVRRLVSHTAGSGLVSYGEGPFSRLVVEGGALTGIVLVAGVGATIDGLTLTGDTSELLLGGQGHTVRRSWLTAGWPNWHAGRPGVVTVSGTDMRVIDNVITTDLGAGSGSAVALTSASASAIVVGNTLHARMAVRATFDGTLDLTSDRNVWCTTTTLAETGSSAQNTYTMAQWQGLGFDLHSATVTCP